MKHALILSAVAVVAGTPWRAAAQSAETLWANHCVICHGDSAQGGGAGAPSFLTAEKRAQGLDRSFFGAIKKGRPDNGMEAFGEVLTDAQCWALVVHIRELQERAHRKDVGSPNPKDGAIRSTHHAYTIEDVVGTGLKTPWTVGWLPDASPSALGTMLITERGGTVRTFAGGTLSEPVSGVPESVEVGQGGLMEVAVHPEYAANGWVYLTYTHPSGEERKTFTRVVRGRIKDGAWTDQETIWEAKREHYVASGVHFGSRLVFQKAPEEKDDAVKKQESRPRWYLYFCLGDRGESPAKGAEQGAQLVTRPTGKVHRMWDDGSIPKDNPFVDEPDAYPSVWSYGHRNPQGLTLDLDGNLWDTEHGPRGGDELNRIEKGRNYGWPIVSFGINYNDTALCTPFPDVAGITEKNIVMPAWRWLPSIGACGLDVVRAGVKGEAFPEWRGDLIAGGLSGANVDRIRVKANDKGGFDIVEREELVHGMGRVRDVECGPDGMVYVVLNQPDKVVRLTPVAGK